MEAEHTITTHSPADPSPVDLIMFDIGRILSGVEAASVESEELFRNLASALTEFDRDRTAPVVGVVGHVGNYWRNWLLVISRVGPLRPSAMRRLLATLDPSHPMSQKVLTHNLRMLERDGMYTRTVVADVRRHVEYTLTPLGCELSDLVMNLIGWGFEHSSEIDRARVLFDGSAIDRADAN
ncbi:helix-turn-helix domain-containing protein [Rhodococcus ruber]|uniref:Helix-turn-helix domain-containing protein n=1 Tax=Rhodococcus ruber TaxID=1830 RepID=A0ABT4MI64_9NOCA|nr:helix-turn-helix domain-containing protein [Rhodococcus ruber]MCZ4519421.1 helix-turn-helix domain-containing protein [Rhodococcus ruber]